MSARLSGADRWLLPGVAVAFLLLTVLSVFSSGGDQENSPVPSVFSSAPAGARGVYLFLAEGGRTVHVWDEAPTELPKPLAGEAPLLIIAEPTEDATGTDRRAIDAFMQAGGRVLFCGARVEKFFRGISVMPFPHGDREEFSAVVPSPLSRGAHRINMKPSVFWRDTRKPAVVLYGDTEEDEGVVAVWPAGKGQGIWWAAATPITNAGIRREDNLRLFLNAVGTGPVYFDEYFHGARRNLAANLWNTPYAWGILQLACATLLALFSFARRSGPVLAAAVESRLSPIEFASTMGGLYKRAKAFAIPVDVYYRNLRMVLMRRLGVTGDVSDEVLARDAGQRLGLNSAALRAALENSQNARNSKDALRAVRELESFLSNLR